MIELLAAVVIDTAFFGDPRYWPPECHRTCVLTGLGGIVEVWEDHVDRHRGKVFVVRGVCASACVIAVDRAIRKGEKVRVEPGARLIPHKPSRAIWGRLPSARR